MFSALYDFFYNNLMNGITTGSSPYTFMTRTVTIFGYGFSFGQYFALIFSLIAFVFIVVLCCLFVYKIVKLIGGLIR